MNEIPEFEEAMVQFRKFLRECSHGDNLFWVFREEVWQRSPDEMWVRYPPRLENEELARKVFYEGRARGLVELIALASIDDTIAASVWYPKSAGEEVQGGNRGMKLAISSPLLRAKPVSKILWRSLPLFPKFRHYQSAAIFIGTRDWAAAQQAPGADSVSGVYW